VAVVGSLARERRKAHVETQRNRLPTTVIALCAVVALFVAGCPTAGTGGGGGNGGSGSSGVNTFSEISGSGTITVEVNGALDAHGNRTLMYGAAGIVFGPVERLGSDVTIDSNDMSLTIPAEGGETDFVFAGADPVSFVGCVIDVDGDGRADDGDWYAKEVNVTVNGDTTVSFEYPDDFTQITGSGTVTLQIEGANDEHAGTTLSYGAAGIPFGQFERAGDTLPIDGDPFTVSIPQPESETGTAFVFTGGDTIRGVGCIIDVNENERADDGDWYAKRLDLTVNGDQTITFTYPDDFVQITGSGTITLEIRDAGSHAGEPLMYGASGVFFGGNERVGNDVTVSAGTMSLTIPEPEGGGDFVFTGGDTVGFVGCIIDVNANELADDGDWYSKAQGVAISGDQTVVFQY
jgi:hypothetical protein